MTDMELEKLCSELVDKCKHEAKQLVEFTATRRKIHWTHPSFVSFCVSVEDILSYEVKKKYQSYRVRVTTPSGRILQDLGKTLPEAAALYDKCFDVNSREKQDYSFVHVVSPAERKVGWIRAALVEGKLQIIVGSIMKNRKQFYTKKSVLCHPVYGEIFQYLIDGPCSIRYSRVKTSDISIGAPSPSELVKRHSQVLSISSVKGKQDGARENIATEAAWDHVRSLYQSNSSTCLFGKNNIMVQPAGFTESLQGYLTLQQGLPSLMLKWIPNALLQDSSNTHSALWKTVMSVEIVKEVAHMHCHRSPGHSAELILIGYDGIAYPPLLFPHQPSFFLFLECLENSLLPRGCLEPPLWYIKEKTVKMEKGKLFSTNLATKNEGEWFDAMEIWNQVFRIRYGTDGRREEDEKSDDKSEKIIQRMPSQIKSLPINLHASSGGGGVESSESEGSDAESVIGHISTSLLVTVEKPGSLVRRDWEKFQSKVARQLLSRYFYSWLSHCRHMSNIRSRVSHLVSTSSLYISEEGAHHRTNESLNRTEWESYLQSQDQPSSWQEIMKCIYFRGIDQDIRKEVWPHLLGVYPVGSTEQERKDLLKRYTEEYKKVMSEWKEVEATKKEIELEVRYLDEEKALQSRSPSLSTISQSSLDLARVNQECGEHDTPSHDGSCDHQPDSHSIHDQSHDDDDDDDHVQPCAEVGDISIQSEVLESSYNQSPDQSHDQTPDQSPDSSPHKHLSHVESDPSPVITDGNGAHLHPLFYRPDPEELVMSSRKLDSKGKIFIKELYNIDKDIPRCDRDYWYFKEDTNLVKVRDVVCTFVWSHLSEGYSQGMCDLLTPLLVIMNDEALVYACYLKIMETAIKLFPPNTTMNTRLANVQVLLQVMEPDFYQYLTERPMGDGLFYAYRWLLVTFKREFTYENVFRLWETIWAARRSTVTENFEEFFALAIMKQFKSAIMDAHLDPSDILNLFTDLAEKRAIDGSSTIRIAQEIIQSLQIDLTKKDSIEA